MATPVQAGKRLPIIDMLRGWALIGVVIMNYIEFFKPSGPFPGFDKVIFYPLMIVFRTKSWMLLSFLFGYGFSIQMGRRSGEKGADLFFIRRMAVLLLISFVNIALFYGDILHDYALLGVVLLLLIRIPERIWPWISALLLLAPIPFGYFFPGVMNYEDIWSIPGNSAVYMGRDLLAIFQLNFRECWRLFASFEYGVDVHLVMLSMMLLGAYAERTGLFQRLTDPRIRGRLFRASLVGSVIGLTWTIILRIYLRMDMIGYTSWFIAQFLLGAFFMMALTMLWHGGKLGSFFTSLSCAGRMTLTNYLVQNLLFIPLMSGVGLGWGLRPVAWPYIILAILVYSAQLRFSKWWLARYEYGPAEWLWRCLSYGKRFALKRSQA